MLGAIILAIMLVFVVPISVMMSGAALSAVFGWTLTNEGEATNEGSELIELNR